MTAHDTHSVELRRENRELYAELKALTAAPQDASSADVSKEYAVLSPSHYLACHLALCAATSRDDTHFNADAADDRVAANLEAQKARNVILRNVIQLLVLESGVNWAQEPALRAVFLD